MIIIIIAIINVTHGAQDTEEEEEEHGQLQEMVKKDRTGFYRTYQYVD